MRNEKIEKLAEAFYDSTLPYHNFDHIRYVLAAGDKIIEKCKKEAIAIDETVVYYALLFHDAGYHEDHIKLGYDSKEAYSADLAERELQNNDIDKNKIQKIKTAILCTHVDAKCGTNEDKAVRAADLSGLAADYEVFKENTVNLKKEFEMMTGTEMSWDNWRKTAINRVELFLREDLDITSDYYNADGQSIFHVAVRENLQTLLQDESET